MVTLKFLVPNILNKYSKINIKSLINIVGDNMWMGHKFEKCINVSI